MMIPVNRKLTEAGVRIPEAKEENLVEMRDPCGQGRGFSLKL